ncbi:peptidoglycan bridge formation glycyltransferase FemA/FemB family protein [Streptococcus sp. DD13]|uniref:peptidoglycan bridge formation glycyltransferase FemA/FemB family protein n=1 Tax=Streptococcus sp. DD13 TaxID=1777881 RepID=UPI0008355F59|nr:peptidoglycan bridge formation glycyltransferase FemA/FemB family protein [Streptococcus sp. DD13]
MIIKELNKETFQHLQDQYPASNFLQSAQMMTVQERTNRFSAVESLGIYREGDQEIIGQVILVYRKRHRFFTEALALHGPLMAFDNPQLVTEVLLAIESYLRKKKVATFSFYPYAIETVRTADLEPLLDNQLSATREAIQGLGYKASFDPMQSTIVNTMFVKNLSSYSSVEDIHEAFSPSLKRDLKKFSALAVKVEELPDNRLDEFYQILQETGKRKGFAVQELSYFQKIKESFGNQAKFMLAYLDCQEYQDYLSQQIDHFETLIDQLKNGLQKKRTKGQIADAQDQLNSYYKRKEQFIAMEIEGDKLPLSSYLFICTDNEVVSFSGGNDERYMNFGGATLLHWDMIQFAFHQGVERFNFYGTIETDDARKGQGNFNFKRQFGGELQTLPGQFTKHLNRFYSLISNIRS